MGMAQPLFPKFFAEGVRAAKRITSEIKNRKGVPIGIVDVIPILGLYPASNPPSQYTFTRAGDDPVPLYAVDGDEVPINLITSSYYNGTTTTYLDLNGNKLQELVIAHNAWMQQFSSVFTGLTQLGAEKGINALNVADVSMATVFRYNPSIDATGSPSSENTTKTGLVNPRKKAMAKGLSKKELRVGSTRSLLKGVHAAPVGNTYMDDVGVTMYTGNQPFLAASWKYKQLIPCACFYATNSSGQGSIGEYQVQMMEPFCVPVSSFVTTIFSSIPNKDAYPTVINKGYCAATLDIKNTKGTGQSEVERDLDELGKMGRGGFLVSLANTFAHVVEDLVGF
jgi:hypothetical protein